MSITTTTGVSGNPAATSSGVVSGSQTDRQPAIPPSTNGDLQGASGAAYAANSHMFMEAPKLDNASMMLMLTKLQSKLADQQTTLAGEDIKSKRKDMKDMHEKRISKMQEYWDKMASSTKGGFFGRLFKGLKALFSGDIKGFCDNMEKAFTEDIVTAIISVVVMTVCCATMGPMGALVAMAVLTPSMMGDPMLMGEFADMMGLEGDAKEDFMKAMKWTGFALEIIVDIAIAVAVSVATGGAATGPVIALLVAKASVIAARETERGVRDYQATKAQAEGLEAYADADRLQADANVVQTNINKDMDRMKDFLDNFAKVIQDSARMLQKNYQATQAAATSV